MVSRKDVAVYVADRLQHGRARAIEEAAAWLISHRRTRQVRYLAQDVAEVMAERGYVLTEVTTARPLPDHAYEQIGDYVHQWTDVRELEMVSVVDPHIMGGARIAFAGLELDATVRTKLAKFVEGASK